MSITDERGGRPLFRTRIAGYDREEVRAFVTNLLGDFAAERREREGLQRLLAEDTSTLSSPPPPLSAAAADASRVLQAAERVADDVRLQAADDAARLVAEGRAQAAGIVEDAERRAAGIVKDAEIRAAAIVQDATTRHADIEQRASALRVQYHQLRTAFENAADVTASALSEIAHVENELPASKAEPAGV